MTQEQKEMFIQAIEEDRKKYDKDISEINNLRDYVKFFAPKEFHSWIDTLFDK